MAELNTRLTADPLFVGATRPPMRWGVTYSALLFNMVFTMEAFLLTKNLLTLLVAAPIHGVCLLLCTRDARFFDLVLLWARTRLPALFGQSARVEGEQLFASAHRCAERRRDVAGRGDRVHAGRMMPMQRSRDAARVHRRASTFLTART